MDNNTVELEMVFVSFREKYKVDMFQISEYIIRISCYQAVDKPLFIKAKL